jgi:hypothetical protein
MPRSTHTPGPVAAQVTKLALAALDHVAETPADLITLSEDLLAAADELRAAARDASNRALPYWPRKRGYRLPIERVGVFQFGLTGAQYEWDNRAIGVAVVEAGADRIHHPADVVPVLLGPSNVSYWRTGDLEQLGIAWEPHRTTVREGQPCIQRARG